VDQCFLTYISGAAQVVFRQNEFNLAHHLVNFLSCLSFTLFKREAHISLKR